MIDWQRLLLNLRKRYKPLAQVADEIDCDEQTLCRLARGETKEPRWSVGIKLLDLHLDKCPELHKPNLIMLPTQGQLFSAATKLTGRRHHADLNAAHR
jgi:hypothetical protein